MSQNLQTVVADLESAVIQVYQILFKIMEQENIELFDVPFYFKYILLHQPQHPYFYPVWQRYQNAFKTFETAIGKEGIDPQLDYDLMDATFDECSDLDLLKVLYMQKLYAHFHLDFQDVRQQLYTKFYFFNPPTKEKYQVSEEKNSLRSRSCSIM